MNTSIEKWNGNVSPSPERRMMNDALMRLSTSKAIAPLGRGRLIFGLDLTASREASLFQARIATAAMFEAIKSVGSIAVKLIYYRGDNECRATDWHNDPSVLAAAMRRLSCETGCSQVGRLLANAFSENAGIAAVVFVGDHCEEDRDELVASAKRFGEHSVPLFIFHECADHDQRSIEAKPIFKRMAAASGGVYCEFKPDSGAVLRELLTSVAAFAAGGAAAVKQARAAQTPEAQQLQKQLLCLGPGSGTSATNR